MKFTKKESEKISFYLSGVLETLKEEKRIGRCHYNNDFTERDELMLVNAIKMIAEGVWDNQK